jgi:hypothetical protein
MKKEKSRMIFDDMPKQPVHIEHQLQGKPFSNYTLAFIKPKPKPKKGVGYNDLPCTDEDRETIGYIVRTISEKGVRWLFGHRREMNSVGDSINHVHPLKFLETIFSNSELKECMKAVFDSVFKRNGFMHGGLSDGLTSRSNVGELDKYVSEFSKAVGHTKEEIKPFFDNQDWEGLVHFLIYN